MEQEIVTSIHPTQCCNSSSRPREDATKISFIEPPKDMLFLMENTCTQQIDPESILAFVKEIGSWTDDDLCTTRITQM